MVATLDVPVAHVAPVLASFTAIFTVIVLLFRALVCRGYPSAAAIVTPAAWAGTEWLVATLGSYGTNWSLANTQAGVLPVIQIASLTGVFGVSFLVFGASASVAAAFAPSVTVRVRTMILSSAVVVGAAVLGAGAIRSHIESTGPLVRVDLVVASTDGADQSASDLRWLLAHDVRGHVVVFPEKDFTVESAAAATIRQRFRAAARATAATIVLGVEEHVGDTVFNTAWVFSPDGSEPIAYRKQYPIVGVEDEVTPGSQEVFVPGFNDAVGVAICADLGHSSLGGDYAQSGARLMVVPALDFGVDDWSQSRVQTFRGVESGFATARVARRGFLTVTDRYGRVIAEARADDSGLQTVSVSAEIRLTDKATPYATSTRDLFGWGCLAIVAAAAIGLSTNAKYRQRGCTSPKPGGGR